MRSVAGNVNYWSVKMIQLWKTFWQFFKKLNIELLCLPEIQSQYIPRIIENIYSHKFATQIFMAALFVNTPNVKET